MEENTQTKTKEQKASQAKKISYYEAVGRRKVSSARVRLYVVGESPVALHSNDMGKGSVFINGRQAETYFPGEINKKRYLEPFRTTNTLNRFATSALVTGGGLSGQLSAFIHATSRAIEKADKEKYHTILKKRGFLTRDPRAKQRRKAGFAGKARARKQSPKR